MAAEYYNITADEMREFLESQGFKRVTLDNTGELVWGKRVDQDNLELTLRVYTGISPDGNSRTCGSDAVRLCLFMRNKEGKVVFLGGSKRVHRVKHWKENLQERLNGWLEFYPKNKCPQCGSPMVLREGNYGKFFGCSSYPVCKGTMKARA